MIKQHFKEMIGSWKAVLLLYIIIVMVSFISGTSMDTSAAIVLGTIMLFIIIWIVYVTVKNRKVK